MSTSHTASYDLAGRRLVHETTPWFARWKFAPVYTYFIVSAFLLFTLDTPEEYTNVLIYRCASCLALPAAALIFGLTYQHRLYLYRVKRKPSAAWFSAVFLYVFCLFFSYPYVLGFNAAKPHPAQVHVEGWVVKKWYSTGRHSSHYYLQVEDLGFHRRLSLSVPSSTYNGVTVGDFFGEKMSLGLLGIPYRWAWEPKH